MLFGRSRAEARSGPVPDRGAGPQAGGSGRRARADRHGPGRSGQDADRSGAADAIKAHLRYEFAGSLDSADAVADAVGDVRSPLTGRPESINELFDAYDRLTPADLTARGRPYFSRNETAIILETEIKK